MKKLVITKARLQILKVMKIRGKDSKEDSLIII